MALSKKSLAELRDHLSAWTLREIDDLFDSVDISLGEGYVKPQSGQRRSLANAYLSSVDQGDGKGTRKLLDAFEHVLVKLTAEIEDHPERSADAGRSLKNLLRWLERDGFTFSRGRLIAEATTEPAAPAAASSPANPGMKGVPEPAITGLPAATDTAPTAFVSYSWDDEDHKQWVMELATRLRSNGIDAKLDRWEMALGDPLPQFMETAVRSNKFVLAVLTPKYREKSDERTGGVGYEGHVMTAELFARQDHRKFIPILRRGNWDSASPSWLNGKLGVDLTGDPYRQEQFDRLKDTLHGIADKAPSLGPKPGPSPMAVAKKAPVAAPPQDEAEPIRILNIIAGELGTPRNDGTRGSALYTVPLQLSRRPSAAWAAHFVETWDSPPSFDNRHRPGIARVVGDRIILDGTTVDEVATVHRGTLKAVVEKVNADIAELEAKRRRVEEQRAEEIRRHREAADDAAKGISFD